MDKKQSILKLRQEGKSYREIAKTVKCSKGTVSYHCGLGQKLKAQQSNLRRYSKRKMGEKKTKTWVKEFIKRYKTLRGCKVCGIKDSRVLEFDHRDRKEKLFNISQFTQWSTKIDIVKTEIRKCDVLCANHHRIKTLEENNYRSVNQK